MLLQEPMLDSNRFTPDSQVTSMIHSITRDTTILGDIKCRTRSILRYKTGRLATACLRLHHPTPDTPVELIQQQEPVT